MKLFLVPFFVLAVLLCTGCNAAPVAADTAAVTTAAVTETVTLSESAILTDTAEISDILTEIVPENTAEPVPVETEPPAAQPDSEPSLPPPAQVHISFKGTPNRYEYMPCAIEVTDPAGAYAAISDGESQIKVRGHSTSSGEKIPYNIKFSEKTELLGLGRSKKWNLLANLYDRTQLRNMLALNFARDIGLQTTSETRYAELYVNGEYRGLYQICEPIDVGSTELDLDTEGNEFLMELEPYSGYKSYYCLTTPRIGLLLGLNEPEKPTGSQWNWLVTFMTKAEDAILSGDWNKVDDCIDVESFAHCYIVQELFKNVDYCVSSTRFYIKDEKLCEGPVWDFDLSSGNCSPYEYPDYNNVQTTGHSYEGQNCLGLYQTHLFAYQEYRSLVSRLYDELQPVIENLYRDNTLGTNQIDTYLTAYRAEIDRNAALWSPEKTYSHLERKPVDGTYDAEIVYLRQWLESRNLWLYDVLCKEN